MERTQINFKAINEVELNDFEEYERILFTEEERKKKDRWIKYAFCTDWNNLETNSPIGVYMPFSKPETANEFALNHYVYWMVLHYFNMYVKIRNYRDDNTEHFMLHPHNWCWACEFNNYMALKNDNIDMDCVISCDYCPLWREKDIQCEEGGELYYEWIEDNMPVAEQIAKMEWTVGKRNLEIPF